MIIVSFIGLKKSGKTTCVEALVKEFNNRGRKVGSVKSMVHSNFTIDTEGKDTWRHQQAGADFVISLSGNELAYLERREGRASLEEILNIVPEDTDILICEGLEVEEPQVMKIVVAKSIENLAETFEIRGVKSGVIALTGIMANERKEHEEYPVFDCTDDRDVGLLADLIEKEGIDALPKKERQLEERESCLDELKKKLSDL